MTSDAAILRAAAAIVEAQEERRPHLVSLRNRLLSLARELTTVLPEPEPEDADPDLMCGCGRYLPCRHCEETA